MFRILHITALFVLMLWAATHNVQAQSTKPRNYDDISRDFGKQAQVQLDSLYRQAGKAVQVAQQAAAHIDMSQAGSGKLIVRGDTIDFATPAAQLYESIKGLIPAVGNNE